MPIAQSVHEVPRVTVLVFERVGKQNKGQNYHSKTYYNCTSAEVYSRIEQALQNNEEKKDG